MKYKFLMYLADDDKDRLEEMAGHYRFGKAHIVRNLIKQAHERLQLDIKLNTLRGKHGTDSQHNNNGKRI